MKFAMIIFILPFLVIIAIASFVVFHSATAYGLIHGAFAEYAWAWVFALMPALLVVTMTVGNKHYSRVNAFFYTLAAIWLPMLFYFFIAAVGMAFIILFARLFGLSFNPYPLALGTFIAIMTFIVYGIRNASRPRLIEYTLNSPALSTMWAGKSIVLVSDVHLGMVRNAGFMQKVVDIVNSQDPDMVLIAGDIIDGPIFDYEKGLAPLRNIKSRHGVIYTPGNHEAYNHEPEKFFLVIKSHTTALIDEKVVVNGTHIIGLDYKVETNDQTRERLRGVGHEASIPTIALLHDPRNTEALLDAGVHLVVSGHTHHGQFFPVNLAVKMIYKKHAYGLVERVGETENENGGISITTSGVGTAMSPFRLGTNPEIIVLKFT